MGVTAQFRAAGERTLPLLRRRERVNAVVGQLSVVPYRPEFRSGVLELRRAEWPASRAQTEAYFRWKYELNPYLDEPFLHVAFRDGRLVGVRGLFMGLWRGGGDEGLWPSPAEVLVAPEERGRGIYRALWERGRADAASRGYDHAVALSANPASYPISRDAFGYREVGTFEHLAARRDGGGTAGGAGRRLAAKAGARVLRRLRPPRPPSPLDALERPRRTEIVLSADPRPAQMAALVASTPDDGRVGHVRDERYYAWRFRNPLSRYRFVFHGRRQMRGFLVLQHAGLDPTVTIVDWQAEAPELLGDMLRAVYGPERLGALRTWGATLTADERAVLDELGFVPEELHGGLLVRPVAAEATDRAWRLGERRLDALAEWDLRPIFSDLY